MEQALRNRLIFGSLMLAALFAVLWLDHAAQGWTRSAHLPDGVGGFGVVALMLIAIPLAMIELGLLFTAEQIRPYRAIAAAGAILLVLHAFATQFDAFRPIAATALAGIVIGVMLAAALRHAVKRRTQEAIHHMAGTLLAAAYVGGLAWFLVALRVHRDDRFAGSTLYVLMILLVVKFTDIGAYFGGRATGKHKLIPWLSPGKTWEGLAFGLLTAGIVGAVCAQWTPLAWWKGFLFGVVIGGIGQLGDLLESLLKRDAEVKDSGTLIPGFGGILDVIDSPLLAAPFAYLLLYLIS